MSGRIRTGEFPTLTKKTTVARDFGDLLMQEIIENLYSPHNSDSSSDKIDTKYTTNIIKINLIRT